MSAFDPQEFLNSPQSASFDTRFPLHRAGDWDGIIGIGEKDIDIRSFDGTDKATGAPVTYTVMEVMIYTDDFRAVSDGAIAPARCRLSIFLDLAGDGKSLDLAPGKNRGLGYLLTATGHQDKTGKQIKPWSKTSLAGQRVHYTVGHSPMKNNPGELQANVTKVAAPV